MPSSSLCFGQADLALEREAAMDRLLQSRRQTPMALGARQVTEMQRADRK